MVLTAWGLRLSLVTKNRTVFSPFWPGLGWHTSLLKLSLEPAYERTASSTLFCVSGTSISKRQEKLCEVYSAFCKNRNDTDRRHMWGTLCFLFFLNFFWLLLPRVTGFPCRQGLTHIHSSRAQLVSSLSLLTYTVAHSSTPFPRVILKDFWMNKTYKFSKQLYLGLTDWLHLEKSSSLTFI